MPSTNIQCPRCGDLASRIKRKLTDRLVSLFKPVKRYRCNFCNWEDSIASGTAKESSKK